MLRKNIRPPGQQQPDGLIISKELIVGETHLITEYLLYFCSMRCRLIRKKDGMTDQDAVRVCVRDSQTDRQAQLN